MPAGPSAAHCWLACECRQSFPRQLFGDLQRPCCHSQDRMLDLPLTLIYIAELLSLCGCNAATGGRQPVRHLPAHHPMHACIDAIILLQDSNESMIPLPCFSISFQLLYLSAWHVCHCQKTRDMQIVLDWYACESHACIALIVLCL